MTFACENTGYAVPYHSTKKNTRRLSNLRAISADRPTDHPRNIFAKEAIDTWRVESREYLLSRKFFSTVERAERKLSWFTFSWQDLLVKHSPVVVKS